MKLKALVTAEVIREKLEERFSEKVDFDYAGYYVNHEVMEHAELVRRIPEYDVKSLIVTPAVLAASNGRTFMRPLSSRCLASAA